MTATALLEEIRLLGVDVQVNGDRLRLRPACRLTPEFVEKLRACKPELLAVLRREERHDSERVGPWQPPGNPRRCPSCGGGLQPNDPDNEPCFTCAWPGIPRRIQ